MFLIYPNMHYSISIIPFLDLQHTAYCPNNDWVQRAVGPPISMRRGILFYFIFGEPAHYKRKALPKPPTSRPSHLPIFLQSRQLWNQSQKPYFGSFVWYLHSAFMNLWF